MGFWSKIKNAVKKVVRVVRAVVRVVVRARVHCPVCAKPYMLAAVHKQD